MRWEAALVIHCYITSHHKLGGLKQHMLIISQFLLGGQAQLSWPLCFSVSCQAAVKVQARAGVSTDSKDIFQGHVIAAKI